MFAIALPKAGGVQMPAATLQAVGYGPYPSIIEVGISKCPGDMAYSQSAAAVTTEAPPSNWTGSYQPCHAYLPGTSGGSIYYDPVGYHDSCKVPSDGSTWYVNFRFVDGYSSSPGFGCPSTICAVDTLWGPWPPH
jgi:hypothetical protein